MAKAAWRIVVVVVRRLPDQRGFAVLPRRWVVEQTFVWMMRRRRLVRDYEGTLPHQEAMVQWAMVGLMTRRLAPASGPRPWAHTRP